MDNGFQKSVKLLTRKISHTCVDGPAYTLEILQSYIHTEEMLFVVVVGVFWKSFIIFKQLVLQAY